jgi:hypothetical protein
MQDLGHRCGYVGISKGHKYYGSDQLNSIIDVHGGITYSSLDRADCYPIDEPNDYYWIGWDYAHLGDCVDRNDFIKNFGREKYEHYVNIGCTYMFANDGYVYSVEDVERDCKKVIEQLIELEGN